MKIIRCFLLIISIFYASCAFAVVPPPPGPVSPVIDAINDVVETGKALMKKFRTVADEVQYYRDEALNTLKSAKNLVKMDLTESPLQKEDNAPVLAATKEVVQSDLGDIKSEEDVSNIFQQLFLTYPTDLLETFPVRQREIILQKYHDKSVEFSNDSMMELYLTIRDLEENRLPAMKKELDDLSDCFVSGKSGSSTLCGSSSDADEELGNLVNKYKLAELQDSYLRMYQEMAALEAQYQAGVALQEGISPFNEDEALSTSPSDVQTPTTKNPSINLEKPDAYQEITPFAGAEDNLAAMPVLDGIYELLSEAQYLHNAKQQLPNLRRPFLEYEKMQALHEKSVAKVAEAEEKSRNYFASYYSDADGLWFGDGCSLRKEYIGRKCPNLTGCRSAKEYVNYYVNVVMCPNGVFQVTEYDKKRGLSKHAYDLYTASKVDQVLSLNNDDEQTAENQIEGVAVIDMEMDTTTPDFDEEMDFEGMIGGGDELVKDSDATYAEAAVREQGLNRWQIGSMEALKVGNDMNSGVSKYGLKTKYPVWGDEMRFYNQYLREKYKNIELHFRNPIIAGPVFDLADRMNGDMSVTQSARNQCRSKAQQRKEYKYKYNCWKTEYYECGSYETDEEGNSVYVSKTCSRRVIDYDCRRKADQVAQEEENKCNQGLDQALQQEKTSNSSIISAARSAFENNAQIVKFLTSSELEELKRKQDNEMNTLEAQYKQNLIAAFTVRNQASNKLNGVMERLNQEKTEYNDLMGQKKDAASEAAAQDQVMAIGEERSTQNSDTPYITNIPNEAKEIQAQKEKDSEKAANEAQKHQGSVEDYQKQADEYRKQIAQADENIEKVKKDYVTKAVELENAHIKEMKKRLENRISEINALPLPSFGGGTQTIGTIAGYANQMFNTFKNNALSEVVKAYNSIENLGKRKYEASLYGSTIYPIHKNMIAKIKGVSYPSLSVNIATVSAGVDVISNAFFITNAGSIPIAVTRFTQVALDSECDSSKEDTEYFVSLKGESCDLTAPKRLFGDRTPPVREMFHFDSADYDTILKTDHKKPKTTRREFLKVCREMPKVWQLIMESDGFVQRDVDIQDILAGNDLTKEFLEAKGEKPVGGDDKFSELSIFLKYKDGLTFSDDIYSLAKFFDDLSKTKKKIDTKDVNEKKKMMLSRDQVGDYLQFTDLEQSYRAQMIQLKVKVNEGRRTIEDALDKALCKPKKKSVGYVKTGEENSKFVSSEFIADDEVYESVAACLDQGKNMYISEAVKMMETLPKLTDYLTDRKKKLDNMLKAMQMDSEEFVQLSDNTEPDGALEEKIKSERTDGEVVDRYADEAEEEFENNLNNFEVPYQAKYF